MLVIWRKIVEYKNTRVISHVYILTIFISIVYGILGRPKLKKALASFHWGIPLDIIFYYIFETIAKIYQGWMNYLLFNINKCEEKKAKLRGVTSSGNPS